MMNTNEKMAIIKKKSSHDKIVNFHENRITYKVRVFFKAFCTNDLLFI